MDNGQESFERGPALAQIAASLPAETYNLTRILLSASANACVFVPIRSMQYMAVVDREEIIFVDSQYKRWVEVAWRQFTPQDRAALDEPVDYQAVFYTADAGGTQRRLQGEFHAALDLLASRRKPASPGRILFMARKPGETG